MTVPMAPPVPMALQLPDTGWVDTALGRVCGHVCCHSSQLHLVNACFPLLTVEEFITSAGFLCRSELGSLQVANVGGWGGDGMAW